METQKILLLDVDGTLVDYTGKIPPSAAEAVAKARAKGHLVYMVTGRSRAEVYPELWAIGLDGMIGGNGNYVEDHGTVVLHQTFSRSECRAVVDWLTERGLPFYLETNTGLFGSPDFETGAQAAIQAYSAQKNPNDTQILTVRQAFPDMIFDAPLERDDLNKVSFVLRTYQDYLDAKAAFPQYQVGTWGGRGETALFGDIGLQGITKANAIAHLLQHLGASQADTIAFGDAAIDVPMLEFCAYGVAMGNGGEAVKAVADYITDDVNEDGLAKAFAHLHLI